MPGKKTVVHVIAGLNTGGAEMMLCKLLARADRYKESVLCLGSNLDTPIAKRIIASGIRVFELGMRKTSFGPGTLLKLKSVVKSLDPDVIHGWMYHGNVASVVCRRWAPRSRLVWNVRHSLHDIQHEKRTIRASISINRRWSNKPDAIIYNSRTSAAQHEAFGFASGHRVILPNGFDCELFKPDAELRDATRRQYQVQPDTMLLGVVARYHQMKGHTVCLDAAHLLKKRGIDFRLLLIGSGLDKNNRALTDLIDTHGLQDNVVLLPEQSQLERLYPAFDLLISSSIWGEAFSNSIGEAMACAIPCVVTDVGDSAWIVSDTGVAVAPGDAGALADGVEKLARLSVEQRAALGQEARARVQANFSIEHVSQLYEGLYQNLIETDAKSLKENLEQP